MSYDFVILAKRSTLPSADALRAELANRIPIIGSDNLDEWQRSTGYLPVTADGVATGFELLVGPTRPGIAARLEARIRDEGGTEEERQYLELLKVCDTKIFILCKTELEIAAGRILAGALAVLTGGELTDPQRGVSVRGTYLP